MEGILAELEMLPASSEGGKSSWPWQSESCVSHNEGIPSASYTIKPSSPVPCCQDGDRATQNSSPACIGDTHRSCAVHQGSRAVSAVLMTQAGPRHQTLFLNSRVQRVLYETLPLWRSPWPMAADPWLYPCFVPLTGLQRGLRLWLEGPLGFYFKYTCTPKPHMMWVLPQKTHSGCWVLLAV